MAFDLNLRSAHGRQQDHGQKFSGFPVQPGTGVKVPKAKFRQKTGNRLCKFARQPSITLRDLGPIDRVCISRPFAYRCSSDARVFCSGKGSAILFAEKYLVHGTDSIERPGEADKGRALIYRLTNFHRGTSSVQTGLYMGFQLGKALITVSTVTVTSSRIRLSKLPV